ncbi:hypothetical protein T439DRAFT_330094 [Meredithblackwellia eburnea MCA 4105]
MVSRRRANAGVNPVDGWSHPALLVTTLLLALESVRAQAETTTLPGGETATDTASKGFATVTRSFTVTEEVTTTLPATSSTANAVASSSSNSMLDPLWRLTVAQKSILLISAVVALLLLIYGIYYLVKRFSRSRDDPPLMQYGLRPSVSFDDRATSLPERASVIQMRRKSYKVSKE